MVGELERTVSHQSQGQDDGDAHAEEREHRAAPIAELHPKDGDDDEHGDDEQPPLVGQVPEHEGEKVGLTGHVHLDAVVLAVLGHDVPDGVDPGQVDLLHLVGIVRDHEGALGHALLLFELPENAAVALRVLHVEQHRGKDGILLQAFLEEGELLLGQRRIIGADAGRGYQSLEDETVLVGAHVLDLLGCQVHEVGGDGRGQRLQLVMDLLDHVDEPGLVDVPVLHHQPKDHQVAHAEVVLTIGVGGDVAVARRQQRVGIVTYVQLGDEDGAEDRQHQEDNHVGPAMPDDEAGVLVGQLLLFLEILIGAVRVLGHGDDLCWAAGPRVQGGRASDGIRY